MKIKITCLITFAFLCISAASRPARTDIHTIYQPDGTSFQAMCHGDEFMKIKTTLDGHAIIKDEDGWWCYAAFDPDGGRKSSGFHIGIEVPASVLNESRNIPYHQLNDRARRFRAAWEPTPISINTKSEDTKTKHGLIILAQFKDADFRHDRSSFVDMLTMKGYNHNGASGSAKEYFDAQFGGSVEFSFDVSEIITLPSNREYYGGNDRYGQDQRPAEMIIDACRLADEHIDFSLYDDNDDGYVDNVFVFFAGGDEAENLEQEELVWSHSWYIERGAGYSLTLDGKKIDSYACTAELTRYGKNDALAGIGTFCHEYSHTFGLPDFYDTDYEENGWAMGLWLYTSLMDGGNGNNHGNTPPFFNSIERELLGIAEPVIIDKDGSYILEPLHTSNRFYRLDTAVPDEYYLIEARKESGWDAHIGGSGMLIYHIDRSKSYIRRWNLENTVNAYSDHQCADLMEADARDDVATSDYDYATRIQNIGGIFFPNSNTPKVELTDKVSMTNIKQDGDRITFSIVGFSDDTTPPIATNIKAEAFMDAVIISFDSSWAYEGEATVTWGRTGQSSEDVLVKPYEPGKYSVTLKGLTPGNKTYTVSICFHAGDVSGESKEVSFMTPKEPAVTWPYIFVGKNKAYQDGTFAEGTKIALMTYNTSEAEEVRWSFNGREILPGPDGYFTLSENGILKAYVAWEDGSEDIIEKKITISYAE